MASVHKVQFYLSYWFQLGKPVVFEKSQTECLPSPVFRGTKYSEAFEQCWQKINHQPSQCFLRGTNESVADLLSDKWDIVSCARCPMPLPMPVRGIKLSPCPCADLPTWPNSEVPQPRSGVCTSTHLDDIRQRLHDLAQQDRDRLQFTYSHSPNLPTGHEDRLRAIAKTLREKPVPDAQ